jgi:hypothetical protein
MSEPIRRQRKYEKIRMGNRVRGVVCVGVKEEKMRWRVRDKIILSLLKIT